MKKSILDTHTPCPKCGQGGWSGPTYSAETKYITVDRSGMTNVQGHTTIIYEHLFYTCTVCGYKRIEPCKDARPNHNEADVTST